MHKRPAACEGCIACPTHPKYDPKKTGPFVPPKGPYGSILDPAALDPDDFLKVQLVVIAMAPSFREVDQGEPLVGPSFVEWRRGLGPILDTIVLVKLNYVNCRTWKPGKTVDFVNRDPRAEEAQACTLRWLVPLLRTLAEAERRGAEIHLQVMGQKAFDVVFQGKYGTFGGSKGSRGQRMNRRKESYDVLADRIERWATKTSRKKDRQCMYCGALLTEPRVRMCPDCRALKPVERKAKADAAAPQQPSSADRSGQP